MTNIGRFLRLVSRLFFTWAISAVALYAVCLVLPGMHLTPDANSNPYEIAAAVALLIGIINFTARPLFLFLTYPFGTIAVFLTGFVLNAIVLRIAGAILPNFVVGSWMDAVVGAFLMAACNTLLHAIFPASDEQSFSSAVIERLARKNPVKPSETAAHGMVIIEADGVSYWHLQQALQQGRMPFLAGQLAADRLHLHLADCGLPSQTASCQAGILYGRNDDIPSFRWYEKKSGRSVMSSLNAAALHQRLSNGEGLLVGGTSINNMFDGDASVSFFTLSHLNSKDPQERARRSTDLIYLMLHPYFFMRVIVLSVLEFFIELWQGIRQTVHNIQPRMNRLRDFYPIVRPLLTVLLRDLGEFLTSLEIYRGTPVIYWSWVGYDEVSHHSGPASSDAIATLTHLDRAVRRISHQIEHKSSMPYDLVLLSDHGHSTGATFLQRYGHDLTSVLRGYLPAETSLEPVLAEHEEQKAFLAVNTEFQNASYEKINLLKRLPVRKPVEPVKPADVTVCCSGNLAQVYFNRYSEMITQQQIESMAPGLIENLARHPGIGFVIVQDENKGPVAIGGEGKCWLASGEVEGTNPLQPFGHAPLRRQQLLRLSQFKNTGDLIINGPIYPDGTIASFEEQIGSHGGLGGEQTDAFLLTPAGMKVAEIHGSEQVYAVLRRRQLSERPRSVSLKRKPDRGSLWTGAAIRKAFSARNHWAELCVRAALLDRKAYRAVADNRLLTVPALLIGLLAVMAHAAAIAGGLDYRVILMGLLIWLGNSWLLYLSARWLGGKGDWIDTIRATGYASSVYLLDIFHLIPAIQSITLIFTSLLFVFATWMAITEAHRLTGWRGLLFPVALTVLGLFLYASVDILLQGGVLTLRSLASFLTTTR